MTSRLPPQCLLCTHLRSPLTGAPEQTCDAYPDGIPDGIWNNHADHRQPQDGDQGITWESPDGTAFPEWVLDDADGPDVEGPMEDVAAAAGHDVTPGHDELHHYWTRGPGLAKWAESPHPWTTLRDHLLKYMSEGEATRAASRWYIEVFHFASGSDLARVTHGKPPRGHVVGPG